MAEKESKQSTMNLIFNSSVLPNNTILSSWLGTNFLAIKWHQSFNLGLSSVTFL
jgi:hypothetical protein